jgi:CxxC motif-containing protein (DUF1111 family)
MRSGGLKNHFLALAVVFTIGASFSASGEDNTASNAAVAGEEYSGGDTTVFDVSPKAYGFPAHNLKEEHRASFFVGRSFFNENWVVATASTTARDGLGPLFNTRSCSACHFEDGRSRPPEPGKPMSTMLIRISIPGKGPHHEPLPDPTYGGQIQGQGIPGIAPEADVFVAYKEIPGEYSDGETFSLRQPSYSVTNFGYGPLAKDAMFSPRIAPAVIGLGLLEAVPVETLQALAAGQKTNGSGIHGHLNWVWDKSSGKMAPGRFGWKAEQPSVFMQTATAFVEDIGITSSIMPDENYTTAQGACAKAASGGHPEVSDKILHDVVMYSRVLNVPARRNFKNPEVLRGKELFTRLDCAACHTPQLRTGDFPELPELSNQTIRPYTDLLLHDMGEGLADHRPVFDAGPSEWRTPPLWGLGLAMKVDGYAFYLHDGRARNLAEAILWHGSEAQASRDKFSALPKSDRQALTRFLESL